MNTPSRDQWTVRRLLEWTANYFAQKQLDEPQLSAQLLLAHVLDCAKVDLYLRFETPVTDDHRAAYRQLVQRAASGEPIAYLIGTKEFYSLPFTVRSGVLIPRPETELLVQWIVRKARSGKDLPRHDELAVLELGTGSGCVAVSLAKFLPTPCQITAVDASPQALALAAENCRRHALADRITLIQSDLFDAIDPNAQFDIIAGNLPYVTEEDHRALPRHIKDYEPEQALVAGPDGLDVIRRAIASAPAHLRPGGYLVLEIAHNQAHAVRGLLEQHGYVHTEFEKDHAQMDRVAIGRTQEAD